MILDGGTRSPFVRRVEISIRLQQRDCEIRRVSAFGDDFAALKAMNPVGRVPVLSISDDEHLIESAAIIDYLEDTASPGTRLIPETGDPRRRCMQRIAWANSTVEKAVAYFYEHNKRPAAVQWDEWQSRLKEQVAGGLRSLESIVPENGWMGGNAPDGSDVMTVCTYDFIVASNEGLLGAGYPWLAALSARANETEAFGSSYPEKA